MAGETDHISVADLGCIYSQRLVLFFFLTFTYGCTGSSLLHAGFLLLRPMGLVFLTVCRLLIVMASLVAEHRF